MWDLRFNILTRRGVRVASQGEPLAENELSVMRHRSQCSWFASNPDRYQYVDGVFSECPGWENEQSEIAAATAALKARINAIEQARETAGVHKLTVAQAQNYINNRINNAATAAEKVEAVRDILLKMVPYLLN